MKTNNITNQEFSEIIHDVPKIIENVKGTAIAIVDIIYLTKNLSLHKTMNKIINKYITLSKTPYIRTDTLFIEPLRLKNGKILMQTVVNINMPKKLAEYLIKISKDLGYIEGVYAEPTNTK